MRRQQQLARLVVERARSAGLARLVALVHEEKAASLAVARRIGMTPQSQFSSPELCLCDSWDSRSAVDSSTRRDVDLST